MSSEIGSLEHRYLRSAIEFAVAIAEEGQRRRPPIAYPAALKPYFKQPRIPGGALGPLRRAIEADPDFRRRLAVGALPELVDPIGIEWLRREDGLGGGASPSSWRPPTTPSARSTDASALRRAERRREAAEQVADPHPRRAGAARGADRGARPAGRAGAPGGRRGDRRARGRAGAARRGRAWPPATPTTGPRRRGLGWRASRPSVTRPSGGPRPPRRSATPCSPTAPSAAACAVSGAQVAELRELARSARSLADRLGGLRRRRDRPAGSPLALPGGVGRDSRRATEHLLRAARALVLVDGYNVAKRAWPDDDLAVQRSRCLDLVDDVARRFGTDVTVVFDGADVVGAHAPGRRLARVVFSSAGRDRRRRDPRRGRRHARRAAGRRRHQRPGDPPRRRRGRRQPGDERRLPRPQVMVDARRRASAADPSVAQTLGV